MKKIILPVLFAAFAVFPSTLFGQDNEKLIKDYISQNKLREYKKSDLTNFIIDNVDNSKSLNGNVVKFQQTYNGFPVYSSVGTVLIKDNKIVYYTDNFVKNYSVSTPNTAVISKGTALQKIAEDLQNPEINNFTILERSQKGGNNNATARQRLVYANDGNEKLRLAYEYSLAEPKTSNYWNILVDANDGKIIEKNNLTLSCNFTLDPYASDFTHDHLTDNNNQLIGAENKAPQNFPFFVPDNASYNVFPLPIESATFGSRSVISNPWMLNASPEGWHSDGTTHYTVTRGNNVFAYEDVAGTALTIPPDYLPGTPADGGATRNFNFPFNIDGTPAANRNAAITNLFYLNNRIHDVFYQFGFTESARNFQDNNFGKGGVNDDSVYAEAQDGSGLNNANFGTLQDGINPRMQMYLWLGSNRKLFYNTPSDAVARVVNAGVAQFGPALNATGITGDVKLGSVIDGCTALPAGEMTGKIGLIERGGAANCGFAVKVKNAQNAGAIGTIIYNNTANGATIGNMGGTDATITIPSILITNAEGEFIKTKLAANTVVNVDLRVDAKYDGSFDNGIVTHEYGHGISNRLTGAGYNCLNSNADKEQMGEGWSDFFALMLTNKAGDNASVPRGIGTYVIGEDNAGDGIRPAKYSPNFTINSFTYGNTNGMEYNNGTAVVPDVHSIGFVWATMLWDLNWKYVEKYGYSSDVTANTTNGSTKVLQLVTDALKLQPCNPTFIDGRNAILAAELATTGGADKCMIWNVFAKRGLGVNASAGSKTNINDQVQDLTVPAECASLATNEVKAVKNVISIYPNPAKNEFFINFPSNTIGKVSVEIYDMSGKLVSSEDKISPDTKKAISTSNLINGTYMVKIKGLGFDAASKVIVNK
ncbi:T9SS-dependent M36 family metallopeptidase [Chryseobacterium sp. ERMR1:04]|uniref:T9SS-dependent M36 family metallopeptidase n=1 Tax=Chryseobacterium sp. ERMR1:04 TaxID=1705393 RepID=UPI000F509671|nr:T9SS-dependent M36 family metallopeptidase [Chryseobacterium sp. ERMR1:04]